MRSAAMRRRAGAKSRLLSVCNGASLDPVSSLPFIVMRRPHTYRTGEVQDAHTNVHGRTVPQLPLKTATAQVLTNAAANVQDTLVRAQVQHGHKLLRKRPASALPTWGGAHGSGACESIIANQQVVDWWLGCTEYWHLDWAVGTVQVEAMAAQLQDNSTTEGWKKVHSSCEACSLLRNKMQCIATHTRVVSMPPVDTKPAPNTRSYLRMPAVLYCCVSRKRRISTLPGGASLTTLRHVQHTCRAGGHSRVGVLELPAKPPYRSARKRIAPTYWSKQGLSGSIRTLAVAARANNHVRERDSTRRR